MAEVVFALVILLVVPSSIIIIFRRAPPPRVTDRPREDMRRDYHKWYVASTVGFIVLVAPGVFGTGWVLHQLMQLRLSMLEPARFEYAPSLMAWSMPGFFLGVLGVNVVVMGLARVKFGARFEEFAIYVEQQGKYACDSRKVMWKIAVVAVLVAVSMIVPLSLTYVRFCEDNIEYSRIWWLGRRHYGYDQVVEIARVQRVKAPSGNIVDRPHFIVLFADGERWSSDDYLFEKTAAFEDSTIQFIVEQTGLEPTRREFAP